jgi:hypothetical protein
MALVIGNNLYTTTALHTKREKAKVVRGGNTCSSETKSRTQHRNN